MIGNQELRSGPARGPNEGKGNRCRCPHGLTCNFRMYETYHLFESENKNEINCSTK